MPPIAIIGLQGRFPGGAGTAAAFFDQLLAGQEFCGPVPASRWSARRFVTEDRSAGKMPVQGGYFLDQDLRTFDPDLFGIARDELASLDPQQRLVLEVAWEALEHAGHDPAALAGQAVGVYVGGFTTDHLLNQFSMQARAALSRHAATGSTLTMLSNRLSHVLDLRGPSLTVDTACASSLSALAVAVRDLQAGACDLALVGGVNAMLRPEYPVGMAAAGLLAPDGRCKPFSARADGYGRGEGCGMLVLRPLAQARAAGERVLAVIEAVGTGHDGRTAGISLPSGAAQQALLGRVLAQSGRNAGEIAYVEAHGTGTAQGDPVEAGSIGAVYGCVARDGPLPIGTVKANIGHLEAAAGAAGLIKAVAMLQAGRMPPHLLIGAANPAIPFDALNLRLPAAAEPLPPGAVAVNAFGYGGSIAHAILGPGDPPATAPADDSQANTAACLLPLSAQSEAALAGWLERLADQVETTGPAAADLAATLWRHRGPRAVRTALWTDPAETPAGLAARLRTAAGSPVEMRGEADPDRSAKLLFVFSGMGPQWASMGRALLAAEPVFRDAVADVAAALPPGTGRGVQDVLGADEADDRLPCRDAQPAHFALQVGLVRLLAAHGVDPDLCLGHSAGEAAAAWASGHLDLAEAARVARARADLQDGCAGPGRMLAARLDAEAAQALCASSPALEIAAVNAPDDVTLAGPRQAVAAAFAELEQRGVPCRMLAGEIAYHSAAMVPILEALAARLHGLCLRAPQVPLICAASGEAASSGAAMDAAYWQRNVRAPVRFRAALEAAFAQGATHVIEIGARPVLQGAIRRTARAAHRDVTVLALPGGDADATGALRRAVAHLWASGGPVDAARAAPAGRRIDLPPTVWHRRSFWHEAPVQAEDRLAEAAFAPMAEAGPAPRSWIADLNRAGLRFLGDHRVDGVALLPGAAAIEAALEGTAAAAGGLAPSAALPFALKDIRLEAPLPLDRSRGQVLDTRRIGDAVETLACNPADPAGAVRVLSAQVVQAGECPAPQPIHTLARRAPHPLDPAAHRARLSALGLDHGPAFSPLHALSLAADGSAALAQLARGPGEAEPFLLHPALLDGVFQAALALTVGAQTLVPVSVASCTVHAPLPARCWAWVTFSPHADGGGRLDADLLDDAGAPLACLRDVSVRPLRPEPDPAPLPGQCLVTEWHVTEAPTPGPPGRRVRVVGAPGDPDAIRLRAALAKAGAEVDPAGEIDCTAVLPPVRGRDLADWLADLARLATAGRPGRIHVLTRGAGPAGAAIDPDHAAIHGFGRTLHAEMQGPGLTLLDIADDEPHALADAARELLSDAPGTEIARCAGRRFEPRLTPVTLAPATPQFRREGTYLITGGLGGFGRELARWLARHGAGRLILTSRSRPQEAAVIPLRRALADLGATLEIAVMDPGDETAVQALINRIDAPASPLAGVFHWAGCTRDRPAAELTRDDLHAVLRPKAGGALALHRATQGRALDHFVMASSLAALVGNPRQAAYAAANAWLDGLAQMRHAAGLPALSAGFGAIAGPGMAADPVTAAHLRAAGLRLMSPAVALAGLGAALAAGLPQVSLAHAIDMPRWRRYDPRSAATPRMAALVGPADDSAPGDPANALAACPLAARPRMAEAHLCGLVAGILGWPEARVAAAQPLARQGLDSLGAVELQLAIDRDYGVALPIVALIGGATVAELAERIAQEVPT